MTLADAVRTSWGEREEELGCGEVSRFLKALLLRRTTRCHRQAQAEVPRPLWDDGGVPAPAPALGKHY